ncbi:MAG TPA: hypothetical protein VLR89_06300 [Anaerolineaceae bacterium]|nr:hypothetical protein [Anaerolineaceae bacterium]
MQTLDDRLGINRLLIVIVSRGKGRSIQEMLLVKGARMASCMFGRSTASGHLLHSLALDAEEKEVVIAFIAARKVPEIFDDLLSRHYFAKPDTGVAFTLPLIASFSLLEPNPEKMEAFFGQEFDVEATDSVDDELRQEYALAMLITDKGKAAQALELAQEHGFLGGTIIRAHGSGGALSVALNMHIEPEKDLLMILTPQKRGEELQGYFVGTLNLEEANTGVTALIEAIDVLGVDRGSSAGEASK